MKALWIFMVCLVTYGIIIYSVGAVCAWDLNPGNWDKAGRSIAAIIWIILSLVLSDKIIKEKRL